MTKILEQMLDSYEKGRIGRREFVQSLASITAAPGLLSGHAQNMFQGKTLNHVTIGVADINRSKDFYQNLLGLPLLANETEYCSLGLGDSFLGIYKAESNFKIDHFCIGVESFNANAAFEKLKKELPSSNPAIENEKEVYVVDPNNIVCQLSSTDYRH